MDSSATPISTDPEDAAEKRKKAALAAKKKADKAAKKKVVGFAEEKARLNLAGWITVKEVAEMLDLTPRRIRDFLLSGRLPAMRVGHTWFIQRKDVLDFSLVERIPGRPVAKMKEPQV